MHHVSRPSRSALFVLAALLLATGNSLFGTAPPPTPINVTTTSLPNGIIGEEYVSAKQTTVQLKAKGGSGNYVWLYNTFSAAQTSGADVYDGLSFNPDGTITGTPTVADTLTFFVAADNANGSHSSPFVPLSIAIKPCTSTTIAPSSPPAAGELGIAYPPIQFLASGCSGPYTYSAAAVNIFSPNSFPAGLSIDSSSGVLHGTPTVAGTFDIAITAIDPQQTVTQAQFSLTINPPPAVSTQSPLADGIVNAAYSQQITATGGTPPYVFSMNAQPPGIVNIDPAAGVVYGTPAKTGTYSFNIGVMDSLGAQVSSPFQVTFVNVASQIQVTPLGLTFDAVLSGTPPSAQVIQLVPATASSSPLKFTVIVDAGQSGSAAPAWLAVTPTSGTAPAALVVSVNQGVMTAGTYSARIQVLDPLGVPTSVPIALNVTSTATQLNVGPSILSFATVSSMPGKLVQNLLVSNSGAGSMPFNTSVAGSNSVISNVTTTSAATPDAPVFLQVQVNSSGLQVGAYHDALLVSSASGTTQIPVSLFIAPSGPILGVNTTGVLFQAVAGGGSTSARNVEVLNLGDPGSTVNWNATLLSGSNWLSLVSSSGTATGAAPGTLKLALAANATQLAPGPYYAIVKITDANSSNSPQYVTAVLNFQASSTAPVPDLTPAGLFFTAPAGGDAPSPQQVQINASSASPVSFQAAVTTSDNGAWLSIDPASGSASGQTAGSIAVSVDPTGLAAGIYTGDVSVSIGTTLQSVNVTFLVQNAAVSSSARTSVKPKAAGCTPSHLAAAETALANNFAIPAGWPATLSVLLVDDCGAPVANGNVVASFSNGDPALNLVGDSLGNYSATWQPGAAKGSNMMVTFNASAGTLQPAAVPLYGGIAPNATPPPALVPGGTLNNLNPVVGAPLSPGAIAQVFGSRLGAAPVSTGVLPLPTIFQGTFALVGSEQAPLYFLSNGQVNLQIPNEVKATQQIPIVLSVNDALTVPVMIDIVPAAPGVASTSDGHIIAQHSADFSLVTTANPAQPGEYLIMYLVGMGATNPSVASGAIAPGPPSLAAVTMQPTVTVDSQPASVAFAGLTPGFAGLYQINFQVPPSAASGLLEVDVTQNGIAANATRLPVSN